LDIEEYSAREGIVKYFTPSQLPTSTYSDPSRSGSFVGGDKMKLSPIAKMLQEEMAMA